MIGYIVLAIFVVLAFVFAMKIFVSCIDGKYDNVEVIVEDNSENSDFFVLLWREKIYGFWTFQRRVNKKCSKDYKLYDSYESAKANALELLSGNNLELRVKSRPGLRKTKFTKDDALVKDILE